MTRAVWLMAGVSVAACQVDDVVTSAVEQHGMNMQGMNMQGMNMQGMNMQGMNMQGMNMQGFELGGATLSGDDLENVRIEKGEVIAERDGVTVRGTELVGARFFASLASSAQPPIIAQHTFRITAIQAELSSYDPTSSGWTYLYTLEQHDYATDTWIAACDLDSDGRRVAIPISATWNMTGDRVESSTRFTFGCTAGVIAKCYRWGYRPWLTGYGTSMADMHQTCTRLARADYCGNGVSHTQNGTWINVWDKLPAPGPIQERGFPPPLGMVFEAGWNTGGAVCLSHARWLLDDTLANLCPERLVPPGLPGATVCNTISQVLGYDSNAKLFNASYLNL